MPIRVLVVDDHRMIRAGLRRLLDAEADIETIGEAGSADEAVAAAAETAPDVVVLDVTMPEGTGIDAVPGLLAAAPGTRVVMLSMEDGPEYVRASLAAGASGYVLKEAAPEEVVAAVRDVAAGREFLPPTLAARVARAEAQERRRQEADPLTDREREVLRLLALGHSNQEIAALLGVSVRTAEAHRSHILTKLRLSTRAELVRYALDNGLMER